MTGPKIGYSSFLRETVCLTTDSKPRQHIKKQRHLPTKVYLVKAMVSPVVMYGCENWTIKKAKR